MEMVMRDVLGGMEELATMKGFETDTNVFEILEISAADSVDNNSASDITTNGEKAQVIPLKICSR